MRKTGRQTNLNRHTKVIAILNTWNQICDPHLDLRKVEKYKPTHEKQVETTNQICLINELSDKRLNDGAQF